MFGELLYGLIGESLALAVGCDVVPAPPIARDISSVKAQAMEASSTALPSYVGHEAEAGGVKASIATAP